MAFRTVASVVVDVPTATVRIPINSSLDITAHYTLNDDGDTDPTCALSWTETAPHTIGLAVQDPAVAGTLYTQTISTPFTVAGTYTLQMYVFDSSDLSDHYSSTFQVIVSPWKENEPEDATFHGAEPPVNKLD